MIFFIKTSSIPKSILEQAEVQWELYIQRIKKPILLFAGFALGFFVLGLFMTNKYNLINTGKQTIYFNLNLFTVLGIACVIVLFYLIRILRNSKKRYIKDSHTKAKKFNHVNEITYEFNELEIIIDTKMSFQRINWELFSHVVHHKEFIFMYYSKSAFDCVAINGKFFQPNDLEAIKALIARKLNKI